MSVWKRYVVQNPMRAETRRSFRRFFGLGKHEPRSVIVGFIVIGVIYLLALGMYGSQARDIPAEIGVYFELVILLFVPVLGFYSTISGEREKRTWDLLRVAPVTEGQIVAGKYMGGMLVILTAWAALLPFLMVSADLAPENGNTFTRVPMSQIFQPWTRVEFTVIAAFVILVTSLMVLASTVFLSARCRNSLSALCIGLGVLFAWNVLWPIFGAFLFPNMPGEESASELTFNPFKVIANLLKVFNENSFMTDRSGALPALVYVLAGVWVIAGLLVWTERTLVFVENDVEFMPRRKDAGS